jgi:RecB family exonuclease
MSDEAQTLIVRPDAMRVEAALLEASLRREFVDAGAVVTFAQLIDACEPFGDGQLAAAEAMKVKAYLAASARACCTAAFGALASTADFVSQAFDLRGELWAQDVRGAALESLGQMMAGRTSAKAQALGALFEQVDRALEVRGLIDGRSALQSATMRLTNQRLPARLARFVIIDVAHVVDWSPARLQFVDALARAWANAGRRFVLRMPWAGNSQVDAFVAPALRFFEKRWEGLRGVELIPESVNAELDVDLRSLFAAEVPEARARAGLRVVSCATPRDEVKAIASEVRDALDAGTPPERVAVVFRDAGDIVQAVDDEFAVLGIPVRAARGVSLVSTPVFRLALSLLSLDDESFPVDAVSALLESPYAPKYSSGLPPCRGVFAEAGIRDDVVGAIGGVGAYGARLSALHARRAKEGSARRTQGGVAEEVRVVQRAVERVLALGRSIPPRARASNLIRAWWEAVQTLGIEDSVKQARDGASIDPLLARDQASVKAVTTLVQSLAQGFQEAGFGSQEIDRRALRRWLVVAASDVELALASPRAGAVRLLDAPQLPGMRYDALWVGGLVEGRFPQNTLSSTLLSDEERAELNRAAGVPLFRLFAAEDDVALSLRTSFERLLFHHVVTAAPSVTVTFPRSDARGKEVLRSAFLDALERSVSGLEVQLRPHRAVPPLDSVQCERDLALRAALEIFSPAETRQSTRDPRSAALESALSSAEWFPWARQAAAMESERLRYFSSDAKNPGIYSGAVGGDVLRRIHPALEWSETRPMSASQLEIWSKCHFLGLARRVLKLEEEEAPAEEPSARVLGALLHAALKSLIPSLQQQGAWPPTNAVLAKVESALGETLEDAAREVREVLPVGHHLLFDISLERARNELLRLLLDPAVNPIVGATPRAFEMPFGRRDAPEAVRSVSIPAALPQERPVFVAGVIDRVDVAPGHVAVIDYKLSRAGRAKARLDTLLIEDFQLPLYLLVAKQQYPGRSLDAAWIGLRKRESLVLSRVLKDSNLSIDALLAFDVETRRRLAFEEKPNLANAVHALAVSLREGDFGARPLDCRHCHLRSVCRISARRLSEVPEVE